MYPRLFSIYFVFLLCLNARCIWENRLNNTFDFQEKQVCRHSHVHIKYKLNAQFSTNKDLNLMDSSRCQQESVPPQLLDFISMVLNGTSIQDQESEVSQACLTIAQLIARKEGIPLRRKQFDTHTNKSLFCPITLV